MLPPLRDTKIIDVPNKRVFESILTHKKKGWTLVKESRSTKERMRLVFQRIHVDSVEPHNENVRFYEHYRLIKRTNTPRDHYEMHGVFGPDHESLIQILIREESEILDNLRPKYDTSPNGKQDY